MRDRMEEIFNQLETKELPESSELQKTGKPSPFIDVMEQDNEITVTADLPGVSKDDIEISLSDRVLTISAERSREETEEKEGFVRKERSVGKYHRKIRLPSDVDEENTEATFQNGVLEIKLPKKEKEKGEKIQIK
ncbi:MAG: Molecular chaperone HSP20 family, IbpA [Candidatus Methanohalarchaeum thermophilum]|uniref:Molecular chaperone HSP20 family, IbpA n=1 Tax=Methanohalarchaeum thermophilum TaxID=1903181 RepID=A0A1Q6DT51_METT1|nr:MAG: Molecular chaperone HSP20 family, IbpA [Candidatus Methanohalarchaeum thermophilum]